MKRYVDATKLSETFHNWSSNSRLCGEFEFETAYDLCASEVDDAETEDVIAVTPAHWKLHGMLAYCSNCGAVTSALTYEDHLFCHHCAGVMNMNETEVISHVKDD